VLSDLLKKGVKFEWSKEAEQAFLDIKSRLASRPILVPPDFTKSFSILVAIEAALVQEVNGLEHPICYLSRKLNKHQRNYAVNEKEALALLTAVRTFGVYFGSTPANSLYRS